METRGRAIWPRGRNKKEEEGSMEAWQAVVSLLFCFVIQSRDGIGSATVCGEDGGQIRPLWAADMTENKEHAIERCAGTRSRRVHHQDQVAGGCCQMFRHMRDARHSSWQRVSVSNRKISSLHIYTHYPHLSELSAYQMALSMLRPLQLRRAPSPCLLL
jgi:hypothetical protein